MPPSPAPSDALSSHEHAINDALATFFDNQVIAARAIHPRYEVLWQELARVTQNGGKRLRPKMMLLAYEAFGGNNVDAMIPIAAAQEVLHASLLIHDDIIDREIRRRGELNVSGAYDDHEYKDLPTASERRHYSDSAALLGGDLLLAASLALIRSSPVPIERLDAVEAIFHRIIFEVAGGQLLDVEAAFHQQKASAETIARYKTASYSFIGPLLIGAELAGAGQAARAGVEQYAAALGVAYQLSDDLLGTFGDESVSGKSADGDLREGKMTYIIEYFLAQAEPHDVETFHTLFGRSDITEAQLDQLKILLTSYDAMSQTERLIESYTTAARTALDHLELGEAARNKFERLITLSTKRLQ